MRHGGFNPSMQMTTPEESALREMLLTRLSQKSGHVDFARLVEDVARESSRPPAEVAELLRRLIDGGQVLVTFDWNLVAAAE